MEDRAEKFIDSSELSKRKIEGPDKSFCTLVDEALLAKQDQENAGKGYFPLRPSGAGYCARELAFKLSAYYGYTDKVPEVKKPSLIRLLNLGHGIEYQALKELSMIKSHNIKFRQQVVDMFTLDSGRLIEGSTDAVMWSEKDKCVLDVKSVGIRHSSAFGNTWDAMKKKYDSMPSMYKFDENAWYIEDMEKFMSEIGEDALVGNITQVNLYCSSEFMKTRGVTYGSIYRYCKSNSETMEIRFKTSPWLFNAVKEKYNLIERMVQARTPELVPRGSMITGLECVWCRPGSPCRPNDQPYKPWSNATEITMETSPSTASKLVELDKLYFNDERKTILEGQIITELDNAGVDKVKLGDKVYQVVFLKSPRPHKELRKVAR